MASNHVKIQVLQSGQMIITVPKAIADFKGWKKGTVLSWNENRHGVITIEEVSTK